MYKQNIKILLIFLISHLLLSNFIFGQNLILTGVVNDYEVQEGSKIYYRENSKPFNSNDFLTIDKNLNYLFSIPFDKIKNNSIDEIAFSKNNNQNGCEQVIHISNILQKFQSQKFDLKLNCDLFINFDCEVSPQDDAVRRNVGIFVGQYKLTINDTTKFVSLENSQFTYKSKLAIPNSKYMDSEFGSWNYDTLKSELNLYVWHEYNEMFGTKLLNRKKYSFQVSDKNGQLYFTNQNRDNKNIRLIKSNIVKVIKKNNLYILEPPKVNIIECDFPNKKKWKTTTKWLSKSSSLIFQIPEDETFGNQTILFQGTNSDLDINYSLENNIKNYKNPNKYDSTKIFTMLDSFNIKGKNGVLFKLENSFDYNKSKPISYLIYMEKTSNSVTECSIRIYEKFLSNKFIKEWSLVLKNFKLKREYYEGE